MDYFKKQDQFKAAMISAFEQHKIPSEEVFRPYYDWKRGLHACNFSSQQIRDMRNKAKEIISAYDSIHPKACDFIDPINMEEDLFCLYRGYGEDAEVVCILDSMENELINIAQIIT